MARFMLFFILLAAAFGHAIQPPPAPDKTASASNVAGFNWEMPAAGGQLSTVVPEPPNDVALADSGDGICYKIRAYIFKRDDDHAPQYVGSTTCGPSQPRTKDAVWPKSRIVPAN